jgi:type IV pilus assembly protein PilY1
MGTTMHSIRFTLLAGLALAAAPTDAHAGSCKVPGFTDAAFGDTGVSLTGNACTDSYNSSNGSYASTKCSGASCIGAIGTNGTASGSESLTGGNACVKGECDIGSGGSTSNITGSSKCSSTGVEPSPVTLSSVTIPSYANALPFNVSSPVTMTPSKTYGTVTGSGNSSSIITVNTGSYVISSLSLAGQSSIKVASGPVVVYVNGTGAALDLSGGTGVNNVTGIPSNLVFMCADTVTTVKVAGGATADYAVYCPKAAISVVGNGDIYGAIVGKSVTMVGNGTIHYDAALASFMNGQISCTTAEVSRATPIVATVGSTTSVVQGTFYSTSSTKSSFSSHTDVGSWTFPFYLGHMRARTASTITTSATTYATGTILFDAASTGSIPTRSNACAAPLSGSCRYIFTNTNTTPTTGATFHPSTLAWNDTNASALVKLIAPVATYPTLTASDYQTVSHTILGGSLGGIDRSTVAVIPASTYTSSASRPQMAYFGGLDGMLHAVCASTGGSTVSRSSSVCPALGTELWAFMPRMQLPLVRTNDQRLDGSVHVVDAFGDFNTPASGTRSWRTILVFQTGYSTTSAKPAAYALDVTDPASPVLLWEYTTPTTPGTVDFGTGLTATAGRVVISGSSTNVAVLETNNGGSGGSGVATTALSLESGTKLWQYTYAYPTAAAVPATGVPGGAVPVDLTGNGYITDVVFGDLYGDLWRLDASTGTSHTGATPLFGFTYAAGTDKHPIGSMPAIYSDGNHQYAAFTSGGYADQSDSSWQLGTQYLIAVKIQATAPPLHETATACTTCDVRVKQSLTSGDRGYSQAVVVGNQLFVTSDSSDVNSSTYGTTGTSSGHVITVSGLNSNATASTTVIYTGGSALAASGNTLYASASDKQVQFGTQATGGTGKTVSFDTGTIKVTRGLWLRTE